VRCGVSRVCRQPFVRGARQTPGASPSGTDGDGIMSLLQVAAATPIMIDVLTSVCIPPASFSHPLCLQKLQRALSSHTAESSACSRRPDALASCKALQAHLSRCMRCCSALGDDAVWHQDDAGDKRGLSPLRA
jgi:hypothetical protein